MLQAALRDGLSFDPFSFQQDGLAAREADVGGCEIAEAFVIAAVIVMGDEVVDLGFKLAGQVSLPTAAIALNPGELAIAFKVGGGDRLANVRHRLDREVRFNDFVVSIGRRGVLRKAR